MSKQIRPGARVRFSSERRYLACIPAILLGMLATLFAPFSLTGSARLSPQEPVTAATAARNAALIAATNDVLKETSDIRGLSILRPVQSSTQSRAEIERMLIKNLDEDMTPAQVQAAEVTLRKLGLAPADFQYRAYMIRLLTEQVAGYYDPRTQQFHLADWIDLDGQKPIMAHELTHALQDQHFNLRRFEHWSRGDSDAELAAHALIEGDATLTMALYVSNNPLRALAFLKSLGTSGMSSAELEKAPRALSETLLFPYQDGTVWCRTLYKDGGWDRVSRAFTELPQSTEQILHPDKYFSHEAPVKVSLPDIALLLTGNRRQGSGGSGQPPAIGRQTPVSKSSSPATRSSRARSSGLPTPAAWRRIDYDVQGEWGLYLILDQFLKSSTESRRATAGWGGDRFAIYEGPKGESCFVSLSVWDAENDAREFFDAYVKRIQLRYPDATPLSLSESPRPTGDARVFGTSEGTVAIQQRGLRVLILEGCPASVNTTTLRKVLWQ